MSWQGRGHPDLPATDLRPQLAAGEEADGPGGRVQAGVPVCQRLRGSNSGGGSGGGDCI